MGNCFKNWATTRELQGKREEEWGLYITRMHSFLQAFIRNHHPQYKFQVPQICEEDQRNCLRILFSVTRNDIRQFKKTLYAIQSKDALHKCYNLTSSIFLTRNFVILAI
jgi:hypothetical protein